MTKRHKSSPNGIVPAATTEAKDSPVCAPLAIRHADLIDEGMSPSLEILCKRIIGGHRHVTLLATGSAIMAVKTGQAMIQAKAMVGHGNFLPWVDKELTPVCTIARRTAQRYMQLAKNKQVILDKINKTLLSEHNGMLDLEQAEKVLATLQLKDALSLLAWSPTTESKATNSDPLFNATSPHPEKAEISTPPEVIAAVRGFFHVSNDWAPSGEMPDGTIDYSSHVHTVSHEPGSQADLVGEKSWRNKVFLHFPGGRQAATWIERTLLEYGQSSDREAVLFLSASSVSQCEQSFDPFPRVILRELVLNTRGGSKRKTRSNVPWLVGLIAKERLVDFHDAFHTLGPVFAPVPFISENDHV